jgi:16S rRNA (adenine1518-N6/adenine1519-N6)-dimethyltransferase
MHAAAPRRRFSQNFLIDRGIIERIITAIAAQPQDRILEIGPGRGALTGPLLERVQQLHAVEIDRDAARTLAARFPGERLRLHVGDALDFDYSALGPDLRVVGNLPYHISTPLLFRIDRSCSALRDCHFMLQKDVVERMAALPGSAQYARLSVMLQYRWRIEPLFEVSPDAFYPRPKVWSAVVRLLPHAALPHPARDEAGFARVVKAAFGQRRKTLRNALRGVLDEEAIRRCGIDPQARGETLALAEFVRLADAAATAMPWPG